MSDDLRRVLAMVADGKITVGEGERLIAALGKSAPQAERPAPRFLRIEARSSGEGKDDSFRVKVPLALIRAGMKMRGLVPEKARAPLTEKLRAKGIEMDVFEMSDGDIDGFIRVLGEIEIEADGDGDRLSVRLE